MYENTQFPAKVWDGDTINPWRRGRSDNIDPRAKDWDRIVAEVIATQETLKSLMEGGSDSGTPLQIKVGAFQCPDVPGIIPISGVGFKPKCVEFHVSKSPGTQLHFCCGVGMMDAYGNQNSMTWAGIAKNCYRGNSSVDKVISTTNVNTITVEAGYVSMDDDGFTIDFTIVNSVFIIRWKAIG